MTDTTAYEFLLSGLTDNDKARFAQGMDNLAAYEAAGFLLQVEFKDKVNYGISRGFEESWRTLIRGVHMNNGKYQSLNQAERDLDMSLSIVYPHVVPGYLKRVEKAVKADGAMRNDMIRLLTEMLPIAERLKALKEKIGKRTPGTGKMAQAAAEREAKTMTCQCCGRGILAETGLIAHHGYRRPQGMGFQTASCYGAKEVPFEVSRDALGAYIKALECHVIRTDAARSRVQAETQGVSYTYSDRTRCSRFWEQGVATTVHDVTRETFPAIYEKTRAARENATQANHHRVDTTFDALKDRAISALSADIAATESEIDMQRRRWHGWKQTHERVAGEWVAL